MTSAVSSTDRADRFEAFDICVHFGGVKAVDGVSISFGRGEILGLVGPNGAGKTTLVNALTGFEKPSSGSLSLAGRDLTGKAPHKMAAAGVSRTFQAGRLFDHLTVLENLEVAALSCEGRRRGAVRRARGILENLKMSDVSDRYANQLSHGEARIVELGRAIAVSPGFLLLDEPAAGLNETESDHLVDIVSSLPESLDCGVLIIEHDMRVIMRLCDRIHVLDHGKTLAEGSPEEIRANAEVKAAYLGVGADDA